MTAADLQRLLATLETLPESRIGRENPDPTKHYGLQNLTLFPNGVCVARFHLAAHRFESIEDLVEWLNRQP